jgi:hypothetical protein
MSSFEALMLLLEYSEKIDEVDFYSLFQNHHIFDDGMGLK